MTFKDHFSGHAASYASSRPGYPRDLVAAVARLPRAHHLALDCGTGNGQAALGLAQYFERVVATDPSTSQLEHATPHPRVEYRVAPAEVSGLPDGSVDLVTAAQAFHWFDFERFFAEVERVLAPGGAVALWTYNLARVDPGVDAQMDHLAHEVAGPYWPPERRWVNEEYRTIPFPFAEVAVGPFVHEEQWNLWQYASYLRTWSATARYIKEKGTDPVEEVWADLLAAWGDPERVRLVAWPIYLRAGYPRSPGPTTE
jgi:ubiquinone/menaquinone biosynthesis C-methylase UbiE